MNFGGCTEFFENRYLNIKRILYFDILGVSE